VVLCRRKNNLKPDADLRGQFGADSAIPAFAVLGNSWAPVVSGSGRLKIFVQFRKPKLRLRATKPSGFTIARG
jgi:hypothetical protein